MSPKGVFPIWGLPNSPIYVHLQPVSPNFLHPRRTLSLGSLSMAPPRTNRTFIRAANRWHPQSKPILLTHMLVINHLHQRELVRNSSTQALSLHYRKVFTFISLVDSQYMTPNDPAGQKQVIYAQVLLWPTQNQLKRSIWEFTQYQKLLMIPRVSIISFEKL